MKPTRNVTCLFLLFTLSAAAACTVATVSAFADGGTAEAAARQPQTLRLRSFSRGLTGSLHFEPAASGVKVRLTAMSLPPPESFSAAARSYVVWAVKAGAPALRLGELQPGALGNGGLEFACPWQADSYSVLVTAEPGPAPPRPSGPIALASRVGAARSYAPGNRLGAADVDPRALKRLRKRLQSRAGTAGFFREVESALDRSLGGGSFLALAGAEAAPQAYGAARAAAADQQAFVHAIIARLPATQTGLYVLWAVEQGGRMIYLGSVPVGQGDEADLFVRAGGVGGEDYDLAVTAEAQRPAAGPAGPRALSTQRPEIDPISGQQGFSIKKKN